MKIAVDIFANHHELAFALPACALVTAWFYQKYGRNNFSTTRMLHSIRLPHSVVPKNTSWMIYISAILSQLCGASTGREGAALQIAGGIADPLWNEKIGWRREDWMRIALAAGFSGVFATPLAGACFALEIQRTHKPFRLAPFVLLSSYLSHFISKLCYSHSAEAPILSAWNLNLQSVGLLLIFSIGLGFISLCFNLSLHLTQKKFVSKFPLLAPALGATSMLGFILLTQNFKFAGLGENLIGQAFQAQTQDFDFFGKAFATWLCTGFGMKGGEVMPILAIGSSFGASFSNLLGAFHVESFNNSWVAIGMVAMFCGGAQLPLTACFLTLDLFGFSTIFPAFLASLIVSRIVGTKALYSEA